MLIAQHASSLQMHLPFRDIYNFEIIVRSIVMGKKWIGYTRLPAEVPSTSWKVYKLPKRADPQVPGP